MHASTRFAFFGALLGLFMAQLDGSVVVAALPSIQHQFGGGIAGVTAAYLLGVTVAAPIHGRLGDMYGRRTTFVLSALIFAVGSIACALAPTLPALVVARLFQGLGGSGLIVGAVSSVAELFDREELVRKQGWFTAVAAISFIGGPPVGGLIAGQWGWQWIFLLNVPVCVITVLLAMTLPGRKSGRAAGSFDFPAAILVVIGGGSLVALGSLPESLWTIALALVVVVSAILLVRTERRSAHPLISPRLLSDRALGRSLIVTGVSGIALFGTFTFTSLAIVAATGANATQTGLLLLPMTIGQLAVMTFFSLLAKKFPHLTRWGHLGLGMGVAGLLLIAVSIPLTSVYALTAGLALSGAALGLSMQVYTLIAQSQAPKELIGAAMGTLSFARQAGGVLGIAIFGWLVPTGGLTVIFVAAAAIVAIAAMTAPRNGDLKDSAAQPDVRDDASRTA
jgi:MFS family permease